LRIIVENLPKDMDKGELLELAQTKVKGRVPICETWNETRDLNCGKLEVEDEEEAVALACLLDGRRMKDVKGRIRVFMENV
jgi:hypothetical protein